MLGLPTWAMALLAVTATAVVGAVAYVVLREKRRLNTEIAQIQAANNDLSDDDGDVSAPDVSGSLWGLVQMWRHRTKASKLAGKGYVKWYKVDSAMQAPTWIKPKTRGAGVPEYYDSADDQTYLFPEDGMAVDQQSGAYVAIHKRDEAEPINLRDPGLPAMDADRVQEVINLEAESDAPGFLSKLDMDPQTLLFAGIACVLVVGAVQKLM